MGRLTPLGVYIISLVSDPIHGSRRLDPATTSSAILISRPLRLKLLADSHLTQDDPQFGSRPVRRTTPERPRYVLLVADPERETEVSLPGQHRGVAQAGLVRSAEGECGNAPDDGRGPSPEAATDAAPPGRRRPAPGRGAHGALVPQRPRARVGARLARRMGRTISFPSNSASAAKMPNTRLPPAVVVVDLRPRRQRAGPRRGPPGSQHRDRDDGDHGAGSRRPRPSHPQTPSTPREDPGVGENRWLAVQERHHQQEGDTAEHDDVGH